MDLTEAEDIKKRWKEYTEEQYKKHLNDPGNHNGVINHQEPDILECKVKRALGSIIMNKAGEGNRILAYQFLKRQYCENSALNMPTNLENSAMTTGLEKVSFHSNPKERQCQRMFKLLHSFTHLTR